LTVVGLVFSIKQRIQRFWWCSASETYPQDSSSIDFFFVPGFRMGSKLDQRWACTWCKTNSPKQSKAPRCIGKSWKAIGNHSGKITCKYICKYFVNNWCKQPEDWYTVRLSDMEELGFPKGVGTVRFAELLKEKYPDQPWEKILVLKGKYSQQKRLERVVASLFPVRYHRPFVPPSSNLFLSKGVEMKVNARKEGGVMNPETGHFLELDIFFPSLYLAFEYHVGSFYSASPSPFHFVLLLF